MYKKEESKMTLRFLSLANCNVDLPLVKMKHTEGIANFGRNTRVYIKFELSIRHSSGDVEQEVEM